MKDHDQCREGKTYHRGTETTEKALQANRSALRLLSASPFQPRREEAPLVGVESRWGVHHFRIREVTVKQAIIAHLQDNQ